jgi:hypothetical protein
LENLASGSVFLKCVISAAAPPKFKLHFTYICLFEPSFK